MADFTFEEIDLEDEDYEGPDEQFETRFVVQQLTFQGFHDYHDVAVYFSRERALAHAEQSSFDVRVMERVVATDDFGSWSTVSEKKVQP